MRILPMLLFLCALFLAAPILAKPTHAGHTTAAVATNLPLVLEITTSRTNTEGVLTVSGFGSGVVVGRHGYVVTCWHVVDGEEAFSVAGDVAVLVAKDVARDLALIKVEREYTDIATWGDSSTLLPGDFVFAIGYPYDIAELATFGYVSNTGWSLEDKPYLITDASINPGNSGGGLFDSEGHFVGMPARCYAADGIPRNINLAIPGNTVRAFVDLNLPVDGGAK